MIVDCLRNSPEFIKNEWYTFCFVPTLLRKESGDRMSPGQFVGAFIRIGVSIVDEHLGIHKN